MPSSIRLSRRSKADWTWAVVIVASPPAAGVACWAAARERGSVTTAAVASAACMARRREARRLIGSPFLMNDRHAPSRVHEHDACSLFVPAPLPSFATSANVTTSCPSGSASKRTGSMANPPKPRKSGGGGQAPGRHTVTNVDCAAVGLSLDHTECEPGKEPGFWQLPRNWPWPLHHRLVGGQEPELAIESVGVMGSERNTPSPCAGPARTQTWRRHSMNDSTRHMTAQERAK